MTLVAVRDLTKVHRNGVVDTRALDGVDLDIARGEFVAVVGPSGCGKTSLLNLLGGLDRPTSGEIVLDGRPVAGLGEAAWARLRRRSIGFVFQFFNLIPNLSATDNVELAGLLAGGGARDVQERAATLLEQLGLDADARGALPGRLSGGQQQRVALARALVNEPALLLADEPTGNLDSRTARQVMGLIRSLHDHGQTIVMVTHDHSIASQADRVVRLRDGRIAADTVLSRDDGAALPELALGLEA